MTLRELLDSWLVVRDGIVLSLWIGDWRAAGRFAWLGAKILAMQAWLYTPFPYLIDWWYGDGHCPP